MSSSLTYLSQSEDDTDRLGHTVAAVLVSGLTIALNGQLGSGKTRFVRALCNGLSVDVSLVNSPTFVIMQLYTDGRIPIAHFDTYRLGDLDEFLSIGADEYLLSDEWLCLIEWADRITEVLPDDHLEIQIRHVAETSREYQLRGTGPRSRSIIDALSQRLNGDSPASTDH
jgi:tRNA threonylcarbamoyladenosine biosynthesis protein TsaE